VTADSKTREAFPATVASSGRFEMSSWSGSLSIEISGAIDENLAIVVT
jgi:hypothetical protein